MKRLGFDLIILGDSTSGKDTQALLLAKQYSVRLARSGEYLRKYKAKQYVQGDAAPSSLILPFLNDSFKNIGKKDIVFVGAARLKNEAQHLVKLLKQKHRDFFAIYIKLPKKEIFKRSQKRSQRIEDKDLRLIEGRIKYYKELVSKTVEYYQSMKKIKLINGNQSIKKVSQDIQKVLDDYSRSQRNRIA